MVDGVIAVPARKIPPMAEPSTQSTGGQSTGGQPLTVLFMPESAYGPTNNCIGIGDLLRRRGHRVVFAAEASWRGRLTPLGFEEDLVDLSPPPQGPQDAGQFWKDFIRDTAPEFRKPTIAQLDTWVRPVWQELVGGARYCEPQLRQIIARTRPDVIVQDNVVGFPALVTAGVPFVRIVSCNPLEAKGAGIPPTFSGYPADDDSGWAEFRAEYDRTHRPLWTEFNEWVVEQGAPPLPDLEFIHSSEQLNLYVYPEAVDYIDRRPLAATWHRLDSSVRATEQPVELPGRIAHGDGALVYFSLGSLGSADVELMRRVVDVLGRTRHRYVVSKGPLHEEIELAPNMWGAEFLPQTRILPLVDLVITHGGNNTTTEAFHFGKPMVVLPLFWDQYDNAQRVAETGFGVRLDPYRCTDAELVGGIEQLLADPGLHTRLAEVAAQVQARRGSERAADLIEQICRPT
jgi:MGT family glycosyltransferase